MALCCVQRSHVVFGNVVRFLEQGVDMQAPLEEWVICDGVKYLSSSEDLWNEKVAMFGSEEKAREELGDVILYRESDLPT